MLVEVGNGALLWERALVATWHRTNAVAGLVCTVTDSCSLQ